MPVSLATARPPHPIAAPYAAPGDIASWIARSSGHHLWIVTAFGMVAVVSRLCGLAVPAAYFVVIGLHMLSAATKVVLTRRVEDVARVQAHLALLFVADVTLTTIAVWLYGAERWLGAATQMLSVMMANAALPPRGRLQVTVAACACWAIVPLLEQLGVIETRWLFAGSAPGVGDGAFAAVVACTGMIAIAAVSLQLSDVMELFQGQSRRVAAQEKRWRALLEVSVHVAWTVDPHGRVVEATPGFCAYTGMSPRAILDTGHLDAVHPDDRPRVREAHAAALRERRSYEVHHRLRRADGAWRDTIARVVPILGPDDRIIEWVGAHTDVTDSRRLEEQLRQAQKMEAVGQLAGGVAHDFNNLLTAINTNLELALDALPPGHEAREDIGEARGASARAAELTRQLLAFGKPHQAAPRVVALNDVLAGAERLLRRAVGDSAAFTLVLAPEAGAVLADPGQLEQVAMNLVVNARDAVEGVRGGHVILETGVAADGAASWATLTVRDNGIGMDAGTQRRIFEPFFTTKPVGAGSGLGLASVYAIVERAGGRVLVESAPARGTTMTVRLPRQAEAPGTATGSFAAAPAAPCRALPMRILLVEDEAPVRTSLRRMLERQGHAVLEARHGADALLQWEHHGPGCIDVVLTDVLMPEMGGPELAAVLRSRAPGLPVLFMSGYTGGAEQTRGIPEEALLVKPFTGEALGLHLARAMEEAGV